LGCGVPVARGGHREQVRVDDMKRVLTVIVAILAASMLSLGIAGCEKKGPAERAGEKIGKAAEKVGEGLEKAADKVEDAVTDKGPAEKAGEKIDEGGEELKDGAQEVQQKMEGAVEEGK